LLRLIRFRVRLGFAVEERTQMQVANAREAEVQKVIPPRVLMEELQHIGLEDSPSEIMRALEEAGLTALFSPALTGPKLNLPGLAKLEKGMRLLPDEPRFRAARLGPFLYVLTEKLNPKEKQGLLKSLEMRKAEVDLWQKLEIRAKKLEAVLRSARIRKASQVYFLLLKAEPDEILFLLYRSTLKPVQERLRNYFQKYIPTVQEISPEEWAAVEAQSGSKRPKARDEFVANRLDGRVRKPVSAPPPVSVVEAAGIRRSR
jgi:tRNA nucleotidyltransferase/poly(A) polymerase